MPRIIGKKIDLHPVILILSLLIGAKLYGIFGYAVCRACCRCVPRLYKELWHSTDEALEEATPAQFDESRRK